jgi:hypothetical protein
MNIFGGLWNSAESLHNLSGILQWVSFALIFVGLGSQVSKYFVDQREKELSALTQASRDSSQAIRVEGFEATIDSLKSDLTDSRRTIGELEKRTVPVDIYKQMIRTASATVEVLVHSAEKVNTTFMDRGGFLAFGKGSDALLIVSATTSTARTVSEGTVAYRGVFDLDVTSDATKHPVSYLRMADYVQIGFKMIAEGSEVTGGRVIITINNAVRMEDVIPPQLMFKDVIKIPDVTKIFKDFGG